MTGFQNDARSLAISYDAYNQARREAFDEHTPDAWNALAVWADSLRDAQRRTGVVLVEYQRLEEMARYARNKRGELPPIAA